jgi:hypothetical protein
MNSTQIPIHPVRPRGGARAALTARMAEQVRAWSGVPLLVLGCVIGYRAFSGGAPVAGLLLGGAMAALGGMRLYYLLRYMRSAGAR